MILHSIIFPGNPNANIESLLRKYEKSIIFQIVMDGVLFLAAREKDSFVLYTVNIIGNVEQIIYLNEKNEFKSMKMYNIMNYNKIGIPTNEIINFSFKHIKNPVEKNTILNIYSGNFSGITLFDNVYLTMLNLKDFVPNNDFKFWKETKNLDNIFKNYGLPFEIVNDCSGNALWIYLGYHKCKNNIQKSGFIILQINHKNCITGVYKHFDLCETCCPPDILERATNDSKTIHDEVSILYN